MLNFTYRLIEIIFFICLKFLENNLGGGYQMHISNSNKNLIRGEVLWVHGKTASCNKRRRANGYGLQANKVCS